MNLNNISTMKWDESPILEAKILISDLPKINFKIEILKNVGTVDKPINVFRGDAFFFI